MSLLAKHDTYGISFARPPAPATKGGLAPDKEEDASSSVGSSKMMSSCCEGNTGGSSGDAIGDGKSSLGDSTDCARSRVPLKVGSSRSCVWLTGV